MKKTLTLLVIIICLVYTHTVTVSAATYGRSLTATSSSATAPISPSWQWRGASVWADSFLATSTTNFSNFIGGLNIGTLGDPAMTFDPNGTTAFGIATSSPWRTLSVEGNSDLGTNALAGSFTATSTVNSSTFPLASTTQVSVSSKLFVGNIAGYSASTSSVKILSTNGKVLVAPFDADAYEPSASLHVKNRNSGGEFIDDIFLLTDVDNNQKLRTEGDGDTTVYANLTSRRSAIGQFGTDPINTLDVGAFGSDNGAVAVGTDFGGIYFLDSDGMSVQNFLSIGVPQLAGCSTCNSLDVGKHDFGGGTYFRNASAAIGLNYAAQVLAPDNSLIVENLIGIGTTTPGTSLSIGNTGANTINISPAATSTFGSGINLRTGCFAVNGTCVGGSGSGVTGGTAGMLAAFTSATALTATGTPTATAYVATSSTATSYFAGNVGVGTTSPMYQLSVSNSTTITVGNPSSGSITQDSGGGYGLEAYGYTYEFLVYAYNDEAGNTVYSSTPLTLNETDDSSFDQFRWDLSWSAVSGADGYVVVVSQDDYYGYYGDLYIDTTSTSVTYDGPYGSWVNSAPTVTPSSPYVATGNSLAVVGNQYNLGEVDIHYPSTGVTPVTITSSANGGYLTYGHLQWKSPNGAMQGLLGGTDAVGGKWGMFTLYGDSSTGDTRLGEWDVADNSASGDKRKAGLTVDKAPSGTGWGFHIFTSSFKYNMFADPNGGSAFGETFANGQTPPANGIIVQTKVGVATTTPNNLLDVYSTTKAGIGFSGASGSTYKWTIGMDKSNAGRFAIASSTALGTSDRFVIDGSGDVGISTSTPSSTLEIGGSFGCSTRSITTTATLGITDCNVYIPSWVTSSFTVNLPTVSNVVREYTVSNMGTGDITLDGNSSEPVHGSATFILGAQESATIYSTASTTQGWIIK